MAIHRVSDRQEMMGHEVEMRYMVHHNHEVDMEGVVPHNGSWENYEEDEKRG